MKLKNILVLTYWSYKDALIQTYTLPYVRIIRKIIPEGSKIYLVTYESKVYPVSPKEKEQIRKELLQEGIVWIDFQYNNFGLTALLTGFISIIKLWYICFADSITYIHCWCTPAGTLGFILSKLTGRKLIIDSYEPHAEAMVESNTWSKNSFRFKFLFYFEKKMSQDAFKIISATQAVKEYARIKYSVDLGDFYVKPACVRIEDFLPKKKNYDLLRQYDLQNKIVCVYAGKFGGFYLTKEIFDFFKVAEEYWGDRFRALLLTNHSVEELIQWSRQSEFNWNKVIIKYVPHKDIADYIGLGDFAITPFKPIPTKRYSTPIKNGEYWAMGLPVVITNNISDDSEIIEQNNIGAILKDFNRTEYESAVRQIDRLIQSADKNLLISKIVDIARRFKSFEIAKTIYGKIYGES